LLTECWLGREAKLAIKKQPTKKGKSQPNFLRLLYSGLKIRKKECSGNAGDWPMKNQPLSTVTLSIL
jgi:hypothetical protein